MRLCFSSIRSAIASTRPSTSIRTTRSFGRRRSSRTLPLQDLNLGTSIISAYVVYPASGDRVVFFQNDPVAGGQMWGTDGTPAGTKLLMTLGSVYANPASIDGQVWFNGVDTAHGSEL